MWAISRSSLLSWHGLGESVMMNKIEVAGQLAHINGINVVTCVLVIYLLSP